MEIPGQSRQGGSVSSPCTEVDVRGVGMCAATGVKSNSLCDDGSDERVHRVERCERLRLRENVV